MTKRPDYLAANAGRRAPTPGFVLLVKHRDDDDAAMRVGITVTKKVGNAVIRNRIKRRFRALARDVIAQAGTPGADHVLIGRDGAATRDFDALRRDLIRALDRAARAPEGDDRPRRRR